MTDKVNPSVNRAAEAELTAGVIQHGGGSNEGFVVGTSTDLLATTAGLSGAPLNAFGESHTGSSLDVTIDTGEAIAGGGWFGRDTTSTVTLSSSTNNQDVYAGWDVSKSDTVIVGKSGAFASADPKLKIWTFDTDSNGVSSATDQRNTDDFRIRNEDVQALQNLTSDETTVSQALADGGNDEMDLDEFAGANGTANQAVITDGAAVTWQTLSALLADGGGDEMDAADFTGASGTNGQLLQTDGSASSWATVNVPVDSVFGRTGAVTAQSGDYSHSQISGQTASDHHTKASSFEITTGTYTGDGAAWQDINIGWQPTVVMVARTQASDSSPDVFIRWEGMAAEYAIAIQDGGNVDYRPGRLRFDSNGFDAGDNGSNLDPNFDAGTYTYLAIGSAVS